MSYRGYGSGPHGLGSSAQSTERRVHDHIPVFVQVWPGHHRRSRQLLMPLLLLSLRFSVYTHVFSWTFCGMCSIRPRSCPCDAGSYQQNELSCLAKTPCWVHQRRFSFLYSPRIALSPLPSPPFLHFTQMPTCNPSLPPWSHVAQPSRRTICLRRD